MMLPLDPTRPGRSDPWGQYWAQQYGCTKLNGYIPTVAWSSPLPQAKTRCSR